MADHADTIDALNKLIAANYDAERGYKESAEEVSDSRLKSWFKEYAQQRYDFGHEIKAEIGQLGGKVEKGTTVLADVHRMWIDIKTAIAGNDEAAVIDECIRGEENFIERYSEVLSGGTLPASTQSVVSRQKTQVQAALSKLQQLKRTFAAA